ncbi:MULTISPECIES: uracil-DNA glycosylase [unclassified Nocardioides]|uniref:uracil-DNA glycosylase n=1 Tax=unclassified Nocardioides TaxID=2615069 RepID=UPI0006FB5564|nr:MULTISPECIES: uracil-DNA glycosylase [unclassified Nocardioides]KRA31285.1 uracil-DNA glycosylase [Nocardioides sp. Root614]KRA87906.1 uracil-DNA glycosylase [Nocardioides sp. Root682]
MAADWAEALAPVEDRIARLGQFLDGQTAAGRPWLPAPEHIFRAFERPLSEVRVLIVGQDPYPTPGHAIGLCFAVERSVRPLPPSLKNIYKEMRTDLRAVPPEHGDLTTWAEQGVMLLNRVLTVEQGQRHAHRRQGWEDVTTCAIEALARRAESGAPMVAILWGDPARALKQHLGPVPTIESAHPSPLSAHKGFLGSRPFTRANQLLAEQGALPVNWSLPS